MLPPTLSLRRCQGCERLIRAHRCICPVGRATLERHGKRAWYVASSGIRRSSNLTPSHCPSANQSELNRVVPVDPPVPTTSHELNWCRGDDANDSLKVSSRFL